MRQPPDDERTPAGSGRNPPHLGWHSRGYLPHFDSPETIQSVTFRLYDSVPAECIATWLGELERLGGSWDSRRRKVWLRARIERYIDSGHGECWLGRPAVARIVESSLLHFDGSRYRLLEWSVMPNHAHTLIAGFTGFPLDGIVHSWKSYTALESNRHLGRTGRFWAPDYFDRFIRDDRHLQATRRYIRANPVTAGLCPTPEDWPWGSARRSGEEFRGGDPSPGG